MRPKILNRKLHRWGAIATSIPLLLIIGSGLVLQLKKQFAWIQPPTRKGARKHLVLTFDRILDIARGVPAAGIRSWSDVARLDVRPGEGMLKIRAKNRWEIQVDAGTGAVLQVAYRRSDLIESLHDGTYFHDAFKLWAFLPAGLVLLGLWITGVYLWLLPIQSRRWRRKAAGGRTPV